MEAQQSNAVRELSDAIFAIREYEGAEFDADYAMWQLATVGAMAGEKLLCSLAERVYPQAQIIRNADLWQRIASRPIRRGAIEKAMRTYSCAVGAMPPFSNVLALADAILKSQHGVQLPGFVHTTEGEVAKSHVVDWAQKFGSVPSVISLDNTSGANALVVLSNLHDYSAWLAKVKVQLLLGCYDPLALLVAVMELGMAMAHFPEYFLFVSFSLVGETTCEHLLLIDTEATRRVA